MTERSLPTALREIDALHRRRASRVSAQAKSETPFERASRSSRARVAVRRGVMFGFLMGAAVVLTVVALGKRSPQQSTSDPPAALIVGERSFATAACASARPDGRVVLRAGCRLDASDLSIEAETQAILEAVADDVGLVSGHAEFEVRPRAPAEAPFRVFTAWATAEVIGTRFRVEATDDASRIEVTQGRVRWHPRHGQAVVLRPGEQAVARASAETTSHAATKIDASPPDPPASAPRSVQQHERPRTPPAAEPASPTTVDIEEVTASVRRLLLARRPQAALGELEVALESGQLDARARQILGYERGRILELELGDRKGACRQWAAYQDEFPQGIYAGEVAAAKKRGGCE